MKINKEFAPITIILETEDDKEFFLSLLKEAKKAYMSGGSVYCAPRKYSDIFVQRIEDIKENVA